MEKEKNSLVDYLDSEVPKLVVAPTIRKSNEQLEYSVFEYRKYIQELEKLCREQKGVFDIYLDAGDIDEGHVKEYSRGLKQFGKKPYKVNGNGIIRKVLNRTSKSFHNNFDNVSTPDAQWGDNYVVFINCLGSIGGIVLTCAGLIRRSPELTTAGGAVLANLPLSYLLFWRKTELKRETPVFKNGDAQNYVLGLAKLYETVQKVEADVQDITTLTGSKRVKFIEKYGKIKCKRDKVSFKGLNEDERQSVLLRNGAIEIKDRIQKAKDYVVKTKKAIYEIIGHTCCDIPELKDYVPYGQMVYEEEIAPVERLNKEIASGVLNGYLEDDVAQARKRDEERKLREAQRKGQKIGGGA
jgi:hypothetical protein